MKRLGVVVLGLALWQAASSSQPLPLLNRGDLVYQGAFRIPVDDGLGNTFNYGGNALSYHSNSLFIGGNQFEGRLAELGIPLPVVSADLADLPTATIIQPLRDPAEGRLGEVYTGNVILGGTLPYGANLLALSAYGYYDPNGSVTLSHSRRQRSLSTGSFVGWFTPNGGSPGHLAGYMTSIPSNFQAALGGPAITGLCCPPGVARISNGPSAFVFNPANLTTPTSALPVTAVLDYQWPDHSLGNPEVQNPNWNATSEVNGAVFVAGTRSVLFWGRHGTGRVTYGQHGQPGIDDICYPDQGWHAAPYVYRVWAYNIDDLIAVKNGTKQRWDPRPYQQWDWTFPFGSGCAEVEGVAYDPPTRRIFITQAYGDGPALPIVYVYIAQAGAGPQPPASPTNVRIVR